ncbi:MAG: S-methyl-5-thioribose-1-phosphate isomerase [Cyanobacteria bacterium REEB67]|nr:S-methyl-5-thioribose-1-phosphate isomerase [Cyanobacteria bacterium REEB67]
MTQSHAPSADREVGNIGLLPLQIVEGKILLVDQRLLPHKLEYFDASAFVDMCHAIKDMVVRGAPSIGVCAAYGLAFEASRLARSGPELGFEPFHRRLLEAAAILKATRPTAVNLRWGVERIMTVLEKHQASPAVAAQAALVDAALILQEHIDNNKAIGDFGNELIGQDFRIITHCNAGSLATCGWGTALGVIRSAQFAGKNVAVFVDETRPRNQGASLTMYELSADKIPATLICDNMSGHVMVHKKIDCVIVGADRIARNGDTANKIGTYNLAVLADYHKVPFYVAAPISTFDPAIADGTVIPIEERDPAEVLQLAGQSITVPGASSYNPAFDVTPATLISAIITERGVLRPPFGEAIDRVLADKF